MAFQLPLRSLGLQCLRKFPNQRFSSETAAITESTNVTPVKSKRKKKKRKFLASPSYCNSKAQVNKSTIHNQFRQVALSVTPLYMMSYDAQLEYKNREIQDVLQKMMNRFVCYQQYPLSDKMIENLKNFHLMCPLEPCLPSPVINGYRSKDEVTTGKGVDNNVAVGLTVGKGTRSYTVPNTYLANVGRKHKEITRAFGDFISTSSFDPFIWPEFEGLGKPHQPTGHWRIMSVRSSTLGQSMAYIIFHPQRKSEDIQMKAKEELLNYFQNGPGRLCGLDTLFFQPTLSSRANAGIVPFQLLYGQPYITERLLNCTFRISIDSFFQINVSAAEVLYSVIKDCAKLKPTDVFLDICCGTGSIGISMAASAKRLFGVEIIQQAIDDAKLNAKLNNQSVIRSIRRCQQIHRLIYVTCRPVGNTIKNFMDLCCPPNEKLPGEPFSPTRAVPVDMFPHTVHCELVVVFER
ncbi:tRNA (uracil-5-)-methyltransferase homolog B [Octopus vulgaris]|uniref:tRNA (uracil(54)-C(5))-methyltransferase n=2 Tax=Octopus vulgaris TaxID=6645 RepID=A0AA36BSM1_OCTVU|nr:tRNA (uracil-5-)-methyltransferase homolog B [Octopus vulgaris]